MTDPTIPGLHAAVTVGARALFHSEYPHALWEDLDYLDRRAYREQVRAVLTAAYPHLIAPAVKAAQYRVRKMVEPEGSAWSVERAGWRAHENFDNEADATAARDHLIAALPLTDPTEPPEAV